MEALDEEFNLEAELNQLTVQEKNRQLRTWCEIGGVAMTLEEFEAEYPQFELGHN
jgi:hypothetical protein